jgi:hypothetical protein
VCEVRWLRNSVFILRASFSLPSFTSASPFQKKKHLDSLETGIPEGKRMMRAKMKEMEPGETDEFHAFFSKHLTHEHVYMVAYGENE